MKFNVYIGVWNGSKYVCVTGLGAHHQAFWNENEKPIKFSLSTAKDIVYGLLVNGYKAFVIQTLETYEHQI